jgi:acetolactate decarboxylase
MSWFEPSVELVLDEPVAYEGLLARIDELAADPDASCAIRIEGEFDSVRARSVPRQYPPYQQLLDVIADQHVFELNEIAGSIVGFRFPDYARGLEADGYHLHFISEDYERGGHVLSCRPRHVTVELDLSGELHVELPPGVDLDSAEIDAETARALERAET